MNATRRFLRPSLLMLLSLLGLFSCNTAWSAPPQVLFQAGFEKRADGFGRDRVYTNFFTSKGAPLTIFEYEKGVVGQGARFTWKNGYPGVAYPVEKNYDSQSGTISLWVRITRPFFVNSYYPLIWCVGAGERVEAAAHDLVLVGLNDPRTEAVADGQWHQLVYCWDGAARKRWQYLDGTLLAEGDYLKPYRPKELIFGFRLPGALDEVVILDRPLSAAEVKDAYGVYRQGKAVFSLAEPGRRDYPVLPLEIGQLPSVRPELPAAAGWLVLQPAAENGKRFRYDLDGLWRFQPAVPEVRDKELVNPGLFGPEWLYVKAPGSWRAANAVLDQTGKPVASWQGKTFNKLPAAWLERDINLPPRLKNYQFYLTFPRLGGPAEVYLNGKHLGSVARSGEKRFLITRQLLWDRPNRITLLNGLPFAPGMTPTGFEMTPCIEARETKDFYLGDPLICPSFRKQALNLQLPVENTGGSALDLVVAGRAVDYRDPKQAVELGSVSLKVPKDFQGVRTVTLPAAVLKTWSPETPNLYRLVLEIGKGGQPVDLSFPESFGYRELWVADGNIYLNGVKLSIRGKSHNYLAGYGFTRDEIERLQAVGQNADRTLSPVYPAINSLQTADETGWMVFYMAPGVNPDDLETSREEWETLLKQVGNHPSIIAWQWWGNGYVNGKHGHPTQVGGIVPEEIQRDNWAYQQNRALDGIDPTGRLTFYYRLGAGGDFRGIMTTLGFGTPIQESEEWLTVWAKNRPDPLVPTEMQVVPIHHEAILWQKGSKEIILLEQHARYFGDTGYSKVTEPMIDAHLDPAAKISAWINSDAEIRNDVYDLAYTRVLRSWRTYGISGYLFHGTFKLGEIYYGSKLGRFGETLQRVNLPFLFYLGGPAADFVSKDHNYFAGETVEKSAIIVNDNFHPVSGRISWQAAGGGRTLASGSADVTVPAGGTHFQPLRFETAGLAGKTGVEISAAFKSDDGKLDVSDRFALTVFPRPAAAAAAGGRVALIDSRGETAAALEKLGVPYQLFSEKTAEAGGRSSLAGYPLLVIGRNSYPEAARLFKESLPIGQAVAEGLNVVILEQSNRQVAGLSVESFKDRRAFIRNGASALLADLVNEDFYDWRGASRSLPAYPPLHESTEPDNSYKYGQNNSFGQRRFWHWSNKGIVATFTFEKPQLGNFRVLMDEGFDLLYTPLVEFYQGKGRILFCQLELVDRFGVDPVATHLLERIIRDYRQPSGRAWAALAHPGGERAKIRLDELAVDYQPGWNGRVAYLDLSEAPGQAAALGPFLQGGGTLVTTFRDAAAVQSLPVKVTLEKKKFWKPEVPADPLFAGVGPSDFSFRRPLELLQVTAVDGQPVSNGVAGVIPVGRGRIVYLQVEPGQFENAWQRGKVLRIYNTLLTNLGVRSRVVPDIGAIGGYGMVEEWLTGYEPSVPDIANRPMVKESNLYRKPALDFDPNRHMVW